MDEYKRLSSIKCAIVHDLISEFGGAERVLSSLLKIIPNAEIYTLIADESTLSNSYPNLNKKKIHYYFKKNKCVHHIRCDKDIIFAWL